MLIAMEKKRIYALDGTTYEATITYKRMRSLTMRMGKEKNAIRISVPYGTTLGEIDDFVKSHLSRLLKKVEKRSTLGQEEDGFIHFLGQKAEVGDLTLEERKALFKERALGIFQSRVDYYAPLMGIPEGKYKVKVRDMKSRYGVNSRKTNSITFQLDLIQYALPTIDSVVVHELAHHYVFNHSDAFYKIVLKYCPDYWDKRRKLLQKDYE